MKLVQYNKCLISSEETDGLVLQHQDICSHSDDYAPMRFPVFKGKKLFIFLVLSYFATTDMEFCN